MILSGFLVGFTPSCAERCLAPEVDSESNFGLLQEWKT